MVLNSHLIFDFWWRSIGMSKLTTWQLQNQCCKIRIAKTTSVLHRAFHSLINQEMNLARGCPNLIKSIMTSSSNWFVLRDQDSRLLFIGLARTTWQRDSCNIIVAKQRWFCTVHFHTMTWHTAVRTYHQAHHGFIIETLISSISKIQDVSVGLVCPSWRLDSCNIRVAKTTSVLHRAFHSLIHQEITLHTAVRTSHQVHHDFIIEVLFCLHRDWKLVYIGLARPTWQRDRCKIIVEKQRRFCTVHFHTLIHEEMTWHTTVRILIKPITT